MKISDKIKAAREAMETAAKAYLDGNLGALKQALDAEERLLQIVDSFLKEREEIVANINATRRVLALAEQNGNKQHLERPKPQEEAADFARQPVWKQARVALQRAGHVLEVGEIVDGIKSLGGNPGKHPTATVQNGMKRYIGKVFTRTERENRYVYGLVEWKKDQDEQGAGD